MSIYMHQKEVIRYQNVNLICEYEWKTNIA